MRVSAFVSGGLVPEALRGTTSGVRMHIVDWYPTFCKLAGVDPNDDSTVPPLPVDPTDPGKDVYQGNLSWPGLDGVDVWDALMAPASHNLLSLHANITLSREVLLRGKYKILTAERGNTGQSHFDYENGWEYPNGTWVQPPAGFDCGAVYGDKRNWSHTVFKPCLFDLVADPREEHDLAGEMPELMESMWAELNETWLGYYHARSPVELTGPCDSKCANAHWLKLDPLWIANHGPICGVPGCLTPLKPFTPTNSSDCKWVENVQYSALIPDGAATSATSKEECCRHCYESSECVAAAWHGPKSDKQHNTCHLHSNADSKGTQTGVYGCVTNRTTIQRAPSTSVQSNIMVWDRTPSK